LTPEAPGYLACYGNLLSPTDDESGRVDVSRDKQLSTLLSEFARTLATDFPIQGILDHLIDRIVEVLPVTAAGVTLQSPGTGPHRLAATNDAAWRFELLQTTTGEGPCVTAHRTGEAVMVRDLRAGDHRFPQFCTAANEGGLAAVFSLPLRHAGGRLGALDLYRDTPGPLDAADMEDAQTLADVAAAYLLNARARQDAADAADLLLTSTLHDALTGLPNRVLLQQRLEHAAERARRTHSPAAVLFVDLDSFKQVNDTFGHPIGDALLIAVAHRLSELLRPSDTLARLSGDEFVLLCEDLEEVDDIEQLAERVEQAVHTPFTLSTTDTVLDGATRPDEVSGSIEVSITASIGMAFAAGADGISQRLVRTADTAMYQAKRKGGAGHQLLDLREAGEASERLELQQELRRAFHEDQLSVACQPIVQTHDGHVTGVEALLRWTTPPRGVVSSALIIAIAEQSALITEIGAWVLERACRDHVEWAATYPQTPLVLAVNVSVRQLMSQGFAPSVADILKRTGMDPTSLVLEMTEGIFLDGPRALIVLADLKTLGLRLALDDFGTGFSSLSYLRQFPVDIIKIDQGFVADIGREPTGVKILSAVTHLAHALDMTVIAEGIETAEQRDEIAALGCELAQGFFYSPAVMAPAIASLLHSSGEGPTRLPQVYAT
jgi:diguanylate cyclase (GGDEF)-like protein